VPAAAPSSGAASELRAPWNAPRGPGGPDDDDGIEVAHCWSFQVGGVQRGPQGAEGLVGPLALDNPVHGR
jgi:hypothetical protein